MTHEDLHFKVQSLVESIPEAEYEIVYNMKGICISVTIGLPFDEKYKIIKVENAWVYESAYNGLVSELKEQGIIKQEA